MERLTRRETSQKIIYTLGHTRWAFDKRDHSRLQDVLDWLFEYQALGTIEKLSALVKAQDEGLLLEMPCKPGTELFGHCDIRGANPISRGYFRPPHIPKLGVDAWLTRAEAEAALGGGGDG